MTTGEHQIIKDFVLADDHNLTTAYAIQRAWPEIYAAVCSQFLEIIAKRLEGLGYHSRSNYGDKSYQSFVQADLPQWREYRGEYRDAPEPEWSRTHLCLQAQRSRGNNWYIGICSPVPRSEMSTEDLKRREQIEKRLKDESKKNIPHDSEYWPWFEYVDERYGNWDPLIPDLHRELQQNGGKITDYFVNKFVEIAGFATPILDDIEGSPG